jgi:5'-nucleotidase
MRNPNDVKLAENVDEIDLILGGHDHLYEVKQVSKCRCILQNTFQK